MYFKTIISFHEQTTTIFEIFLILFLLLKKSVHSFDSEFLDLASEQGN